MSSRPELDNVYKSYHQPIAQDETAIRLRSIYLPDYVGLRIGHKAAMQYAGVRYKQTSIEAGTKAAQSCVMVGKAMPNR